MKLRQLYKIQPLAQGLDPVAFFREYMKHRAAQEAFLFRRSALEQDGEFRQTLTILALDPFEKIRLRDRDPFAALSERLKSFELEKDPELPFFQGGALGYISYDSVRFLEKILLKGDGNLSRPSDPKSETDDCEIVFFKKFVIFDHTSARLIFLTLAPIGTEQDLDELIDGFKKSFHKTSGVIREQTRDPVPLPVPVAEMESMQGKPGYMEKVRLLKSHIRDGDIFQAVLSEKFQTPFNGDPLDLFETLCELNPSPYQFCFLCGEKAFLGASPEMLLRVENGELETHPIAGTRPRGATPEEERQLVAQLLKSPKERSEHLMLVDLARNDLGRVSVPGTVRVEAFQEVIKFGGVIHLVSRVKGKLIAGKSAVDALVCCFPAGTLSGAPKIRAMQLLSELEPERRGFYGGVVVAASFSGDLDSCISIRSMEVGGGRAVIQAGAGIVADSSPEREYAEVEHKTKVSRQAIAALAKGKK